MTAPAAKAATVVTVHCEYVPAPAALAAAVDAAVAAWRSYDRTRGMRRRAGSRNTHRGDAFAGEILTDD